MQNKPVKIKELCEFIWIIEEKYKLFDLKIEEVYIWEYIRMQVYYKLAIELKVLTPPGKKVSLFDRIKVLLKGFKNSFVNNFWTLHKNDCIVFSHPRSVLVNNAYIDIYSEHVIKELNTSKSVLDFETDYQGSHIRERKHKVHKLDWVKQWVYFKYLFVRKERILSNDQINLIHSIENEFFQKFGLKLSLLNLIETKVKLFKIYYDIYFKIFKKVNPSEIYVVVSYYLAPIIKAAKDNAIEVKELQHGVITKYHLGYSYPSLKKSLHYFPDKLLIWGRNWKKNIVYPIDEKNIVLDKFRYLEEIRNQFKNVTKEKDTYLIISQTAISEKIAKKVMENKSFFKGKTIYYKLHPAEYDIWQNNKYLNELVRLMNVEIITNQKNLYHFMALCEYQVGVFSTALYEGLVFNCKTVLLDVDGIEYMDDFMEVNDPIILK